MEQQFDLLHKDMLDDIARCLALEHSEKENVENCYWIARNYWTRLQEIIKQMGLKSDEEEIHFLKVIKPKFAGYIEYFSLLSEGLQFVPPRVPFPQEVNTSIKECDWDRFYQQTLVEYWTNEESRGERHYGKYFAFLEYHNSDRQDKDEEYFLIRNAMSTEFSQRRSHNRDTDLFTPHEEILTAWEGFKLYKEDIKKKVHEPVGS